jgi:hypothetical protein
MREELSTLVQDGTLTRLADGALRVSPLNVSSGPTRPLQSFNMLCYVMVPLQHTRQRMRVSPLNVSSGMMLVIMIILRSRAGMIMMMMIMMMMIYWRLPLEGI